jgi:hypothetical protein
VAEDVASITGWLVRNTRRNGACKEAKSARPSSSPYRNHWPVERRKDLGVDLRGSGQKKPAEVAQSPASNRQGSRGLWLQSTVLPAAGWQVCLLKNQPRHAMDGNPRLSPVNGRDAPGAGILTAELKPQ